MAIKTNIAYDVAKDKFVIECDNLETLNHILNLIAYATEKLHEDGKVDT